MSTVKVINLQHPSSATANAVLDNAGNFAFNSGYGSAAKAYGCRAWIRFNGTGTPSITSGGNVSSLTDVAVGSYVVNLTTALTDVNFTCVTTPSLYSGVTDLAWVRADAATTSSFSVYAFYKTNTSSDSVATWDPANCQVAVFR